MTVVGSQFQLREVLTRHVALPEDVVLARLQVDVLLDDGFSIGLVGEFDDDTADVAVGIEDAREVVVGSSIGAEVCVEVHLSLPVGIALVGHGEAVVVVASLEGSFKLRCLLVAPVGIRIVVERHGGSDALPHVEVARGIEATLLDQSLVGFAGEDEAPSDAAVGSLIDEDELGSSEGLHTEQRVLILSVAADVGEGGVGGQLNVLLCSHLTVSIFPLQLFERPSGGLVAHDLVEVFRLSIGIELCCTVVHIGQTVFTSIVGERATLAVVVGESDAVVVHAEVLLFVRSCRPPLGTCRAGRATGEVSYLSVGEAPLLVAESAEVGRVVDLRLVERELLLDARLRDTVAVAQAQLYGVGAGLGVVVTHFLKRGVLCAVENPDRIGARSGRVRGHHLVGLLVYGNLIVDTADRGNSVRIGALELFGRTSRHRQACKQNS